MAEKFINYYDILGVNRTANDKEIRKAYSEKLRAYRALNKPSKKELQLLAKAYEVLSDEDERELFDRELDYVEPKESFIEKFLDDYDDTLDLEDKYADRHKNCSEFLDDLYDGKDTTWIRTKKGALHVLGELYYQGSKFKVRKNDNASRYILRNRRVITAAILTGAVIVVLNTPPMKKVFSPEPIQTQSTAEEPTEYITINKIYKVQNGDTLSELAEETGVDQTTIKNANRMNSTLLFIGDELKIPYTVDVKDLDKYVEEVELGDKTVEELAEYYETDMITLKELNPYTITYDYENKEYKVKTKKIVVPNFTKEKKETKGNYNQYVKQA